MTRLGVVIPTRNSEAHLSRHVDALEEWLDLADEIVVVDSESVDHTLEILRARLTGPHVRFVKHPPGLYASWNFGVGQLGTEWTYISTVGDTITRSGIERLLQVAQRLKPDVLCSSPGWVKPDGSPVAGTTTPVSEMASELGLSGPAMLVPGMLVAYCAIYALMRGLNTPLCSSASNLYRTAVLATHPFPLDFGSAGDAFWLLLNAAKVKYALLPETLANYLAHPNQHGPLDLAVWQSRFRRAAEISEANAAELQRQAMISGGEAVSLQDLLRSLISQCEAELALELMRKGPLGKAWVLRPGAWIARQTRNRRMCEAEAACRRFVTQQLSTGRAFVEMV